MGSVSAFRHDPEVSFWLSVNSQLPPGVPTESRVPLPRGTVAALPCSAREGQHGLGRGHWLAPWTSKRLLLEPF